MEGLEIGFKTDAVALYQKGPKKNVRDAIDNQYVARWQRDRISLSYEDPIPLLPLISESEKPRPDDAVLTRTIGDRFADLLSVVPLDKAKSARAVAVGKDGESVIFKFGFGKSSVHLLVMPGDVHLLYMNAERVQVGSAPRLGARQLAKLQVDDLADIGHGISLMQAHSGEITRLLGTQFVLVSETDFTIGLAEGFHPLTHMSEKTVAKAAVAGAQSLTQAIAAVPVGVGF